MPSAMVVGSAATVRWRWIRPFAMHRRYSTQTTTLRVSMPGGSWQSSLAPVLPGLLSTLEEERRLSPEYGSGPRGDPLEGAQLYVQDSPLCSRGTPQCF